MRVLSSKRTFFEKRMSPVLLGMFYVVFFSLCIANTRDSADLISLAFMTLVYLAFGFASFAFNRRVVDRVSDAGDALLVSNAGIEQRVVFADISSVGFAHGRFPYVDLRLTKSNAFGNEIRFVPVLRLRNPFACHPVVDELRKRVAAARSTTAIHAGGGR